jgi:hypothetical protein
LVEEQLNSEKMVGNKGISIFLLNPFHTSMPKMLQEQKQVGTLLKSSRKVTFALHNTHDETVWMVYKYIGTIFFGKERRYP